MRRYRPGNAGHGVRHVRDVHCQENVNKTEDTHRMREKTESRRIQVIVTVIMFTGAGAKYRR